MATDRTPLRIACDLCAERALELTLHPAGIGDLAWYAAFREPGAGELTPEAGFGYGPTPDEDLTAATTNLTEAE